MREKEHSLIKYHTQVIQDSLLVLHKTMLQLLEQQGKSFDVTFNCKTFQFDIPFDKKDAHKLQKEKNKFIRMIFSDCLKYVIKKLPDQASYHIWESLLAFTVGQPIEDYQLEKFESVVIDNLDDHGEVIKSKALDVESSTVKMQDQALYDITLEQELEND